MRIILVTQYFQTPDSPGISLLADFAQHMQRAGHEVTVVTGRYGHLDRTQLAGAWPVEGGRGPTPRLIRVYSGPEGSRNLLLRAFSFVAFAMACTTAILRAGPAYAIYVSSPPPLAMLSGWLCARLKRTRLILEIRDLWPRSVAELGVVRNPLVLHLAFAVERFLYRHCDGIVARTHGIRDDIASRVPDCAPIAVSRGGVDTDRYRHMQGERDQVRAERGWNGQVVAIYAGTIGYANDVDRLVEAATRFDPDLRVRIVVVGDGVAKPVLERRVRERGLEASVEVLSSIRKDEVVRLLNGADIGLCTLKKAALFEGALPTKLLDCMAAGLPVVAPNLDEIARVVEGWDCGALYEAGDADSLAAQIAKLASDPRLRAHFGRHGVKAVRSEFALDARNAALTRVVERVASGWSANEG